MSSSFPFQIGFAGELCNFEYNECESNPCLNNGQCTDHIGGFSCQCTRGYTGKRCHIKVSRQSSQSFPFVSFVCIKYSICSLVLFHSLFQFMDAIFRLNGIHVLEDTRRNFYKKPCRRSLDIVNEVSFCYFCKNSWDFIIYYPNVQMNKAYPRRSEPVTDCVHSAYPSQCLFRCDACAAAITAISMNLFRRNRTSKNMNTKRFNCSKHEHRMQSLGT